MRSRVVIRKDVRVAVDLTPEPASPAGVTHSALWTGLVVVRWVAVAWMAGVLVVNRAALLRPWLAWGLVVLAVCVSLAAARAARRGLPPDRRALAVELAVGWALVVCDGWAYGQGHVFSSQASLGSTWPLAGVVAAGLSWGPAAGVGAGLVVGVARVGAAIANEVRAFSSDQLLSLGSTTVLWALAGGVAGLVGSLLWKAERQVAVARAREELGRTLHDGVLQTLALAQKRGDPLLAEHARRTDYELRAFLAGGDEPGAAGEVDLARSLRQMIAETASLFDGLHVRAVLAPDMPTLTRARCDALVGAVRECVVNAGKHAGPCAVTVFGEPDPELVPGSAAQGQGVVVVIHDDGVGFDVAALQDSAERHGLGLGLARSVRARVAEVGGTVTVTSAVGRGTEVTVRVPGMPS